MPVRHADQMAQPCKPVDKSDVLWKMFSWHSRAIQQVEHAGCAAVNISNYQVGLVVNGLLDASIDE